MRFWSEGLGDRELVMGLGKAEIERQGDMMDIAYDVLIASDQWSWPLSGFRLFKAVP